MANVRNVEDPRWMENPKRFVVILLSAVKSVDIDLVMGVVK